MDLYTEAVLMYIERDRRILEFITICDGGILQIKMVYATVDIRQTYKGDYVTQLRYQTVHTTKILYIFSRWSL